MRARRGGGPVMVEPRGDCFELRLIAAVVADQHHIGEAVLLEAARRRVEQALECVVGNRDGAGEAHVGGGRRNAAFGHIAEHRCHQRIAQRRRDASGQRMHANVVLAQRHVRAVLFGAADRNDDGGFAGALRVARLDPGQVFDERAGRCSPSGGVQGQQPGRCCCEEPAQRQRLCQVRHRSDYTCHSCRSCQSCRALRASFTSGSGVQARWRATMRITDTAGRADAAAGEIAAVAAPLSHPPQDAQPTPAGFAARSSGVQRASQGLRTSATATHRRSAAGISVQVL